MEDDFSPEELANLADQDKMGVITAPCGHGNYLVRMLQEEVSERQDGDQTVIQHVTWQVLVVLNAN